MSTVHDAEPSPGSAIFGSDGLKLLTTEMRPLHPLRGYCYCGQRIIKLNSDVPWRHVAQPDREARGDFSK